MTHTAPIFFKRTKKPLVIAGPCLAESFEIMDTVAKHLVDLSAKLDFDFVFKASFDKANRTSIDGHRGAGWEDTRRWFIDLKDKYHIPILTDVHECHQVREVAEICDVLQIPAFLSRQTDLIIEAVKSGLAVNIKKGQFMAPENSLNISQKVQRICKEFSLVENYAITERGVTFGYGNLIVDMRSFPIMASSGAPVIFDLTHSLQLPPSSQNSNEHSSGERKYAPILARAAAATGYLDGFFLEVHPAPQNALSDVSTQIPLLHTENLIKQMIYLWRKAKELMAEDNLFQ